MIQVRWPAWTRSLRWQMAASIVMSILGLAVLLMVGTSAFDGMAGAFFLRTLPEEIRVAYNNCTFGQFSECAKLGPLESTEEFQRYVYIVEIASIALILTGVAVAAASGVFLGARVARPIESVAKAAGLIAGGDLSARAEGSRGASGEVKHLLDNFNTLADGLEDAERELAASASAIAHELRTPVTILRARLQAILDGVFTPNTTEVRGLLNQVELLSAIIEDMRVLSLAGARQLELRTEQIDLAAEVESFIDSTKPMLAEAGLGVESDFRPALVAADPARVRQMLNALLDNARRYAASGRSVRIETASLEGFGVLRVLDRGPGLPAGAEESAFDRFWRGEPSRSRETGGSGLGLAVVAAIAQAHGGQARAFARDGGGAAFEVRLPVTQA